jgi:hypothetical protein
VGVLTLRPPKPPRIYIVLIDPAEKKKVTRSLTIYNISLEDAEKRVRECFQDK